MPLATLAMLLATAHAQTFNVIYNFTGGKDGSNPWSGLAIDRTGNLYATPSSGGGGTCTNQYENGCGAVLKLTQGKSGWIPLPLYDFQGGTDGAMPVAPVTINANGTLYGTTAGGGLGQCSFYGTTGCGTVFNLTPGPTAPPSVLANWLETPLYRFSGGTDGGEPASGDLVFDQAGNLYGTTLIGGAYGYGVIFKLSPSKDGWIESVLYSFAGANDGAFPFSGVTLDESGNVYGTTDAGGGTGCGGGGCGAVYELTPSGSGWSESILYRFQGAADGQGAAGGLVFDASGNLYGGTFQGGSGGGGTVYELSPSNGSWMFQVLYSFSGNPAGLVDRLLLDSAGDVLGTTQYGGTNGDGSVFELTPSGGGWVYRDLHDFTYGLDGGVPTGRLVADPAGNLYGTAFGGGTDSCGSYGCGVVFEITPK